MLDSKGFDLWAGGYDQSVGLSDEDGTYPFAGYRQILNEIYNRVLTGRAGTVLDIGFGTGTLTKKLYEQGCRIRGQDFSERMIELAKEKMPEAGLYQGDFSKGLARELEQDRYDAIIATYSLHHLTDEEKICFLQKLLPLLNDGGCIYIGDVAFKTRAELEKHRALIGDDWDADEIYFVADELKKAFPQIRFEPFSFCAGLFSLEKQNELLNHLDRLHTTEAGILRIKRNLSLDTGDVVAWCKDQIRSASAIISKNGKNWYIETDHCRITVNSSSYTIITAHQKGRV